MYKLSSVALLSFLFINLSAYVRGEAAGLPTINKQEESFRRNKGKEVLKYMNLTANPCYDFYEFACGNWPKQSVTPKDEENRTPEQVLHAKVRQKLINMLEEDVTLEDGLPGRKLKDFYSSCVSSKLTAEEQQAFFSDFIKKNGGFPAVPGSNWQSVNQNNYNWQDVVALLRQRYGMDILIGLHVKLNHHNIYTFENSLYLGEPSTLIPRHLCSQDGTKKVDISDAQYEAIEKEVANNLKWWLTLKIDEARRVAADIVTFEFELCTAMHGRGHDENLPFSRKSLAEFTRQFNNSIDFHQYVSTSFQVPITNLVNLDAENYFNHLIATVNEHNKTTVANYIMYRALSMLSLPRNEQPARREEHCVQVLIKYLPKLVGEMYHRKYISESARQDIEAMYDNLKQVFFSRLNQNWIQESSRLLGRRKLEDLTIIFPKYVTQPLILQIDPLKYWQNLALTMAAIQPRELTRLFQQNPTEPDNALEAYEASVRYIRRHKRIDMGLGLLNTPYYHKLYPHAMRYSIMGHKIAQEILKAFNDQGWSSDPNAYNKWDGETRDGYRNRSQCFRRQISNYLYNQPNTFHNQTLQRELIDGSGGLSMAFDAYLHWLNFKNPNNDFGILARETLPEVNFTNTQLFFISFAQMHCKSEAANSTVELKYSPLYRHTIDRYRVNGPLKNSVEFAREFGCRIGMEMNPADKCIIY